MKISIIIPVYNTKDYFRKCVASVLASDTADCEIILIDDGSTDGESGALCDKIAAEHPSLVRVVHQENKGLGGARNTGIEAAHGDYLFFIDSDDTITPDALGALKRAINETGADILSFNIKTDDGEGNGTVVYANAYTDEAPFALSEHPEYLLSLPSACTRLWKRSLFTETGIRFPNKVWYEDIRTTAKLFAVAASIYTMDAPFYLYYQRPGSIMRATNVDRNREIIDAFEDIVAWFSEQGLFDQYRDVLCGLCIDNLYIAASVRVLRADTHHPLLRELSDYVEKTFPGYAKNTYLSRLGKTRKLVFSLLRLKQYRLLALLFRVRGG